MAGPVPTASGPGGNYRPALALLASLFFLWGFITVINNTLLPHLRSVFHLNYTQTTLIESTWFIGYLVASIPAAKLIERIGYQRALVIGLAVMAVGSVGMILAARLPSYGVTLASLFIISCGIALLQVAANPYVAAIGPASSAESRLTLVQAFNTTGDVLAIVFGRYLILNRTTGGTVMEGTQLSFAQRMADAQATQLPYLLVAIVLVVIAVVIARAKLPALGGATRRVNAEARKHLSLWRHRNLVWGVPAIFIYLIAEIGVGNLFINFASQPTIGNVTHEQAAYYLMFVWGGMAVGRFVGAFIMQKIAPEKVLAAFSIGAFLVMLVATFAHGHVALYGLILVGLFHSIMFPTIFTLACERLGTRAADGSGIINVAICGGAVVPLATGALADITGSLTLALALPAVCYAVIAAYGVYARRPAPDFAG